MTRLGEAIRFPGRQTSGVRGRHRRGLKAQLSTLSVGSQVRAAVFIAGPFFLVRAGESVQIPAL